MGKIDSWVDGLVVAFRGCEAKAGSTPLPSAIEQVIHDLTVGIDREKLPLYYERAIAKFTKMIGRDPSDEVLQQATKQLAKRRTSGC